MNDLTKKVTPQNTFATFLKITTAFDIFTTFGKMMQYSDLHFHPKKRPEKSLIRLQ